MLHAVAEQVSICKKRQWIVESQLPQLFFERLALADIPKIERQPLYRRIFRQITADALDHAAPRASFNPKFDRADRA